MRVIHKPIPSLQELIEKQYISIDSIDSPDNKIGGKLEDNEPLIVILSAVYKEIIHYLESLLPDLEGMGFLFGEIRRGASSLIFIVDSVKWINPSKSDSFSFSADPDSIRSTIIESSGDGKSLVGDIHSHVRVKPAPSAKDLQYYAIFDRTPLVIHGIVEMEKFNEMNFYWKDSFSNNYRALDKIIIIDDVGRILDNSYHETDTVNSSGIKKTTYHLKEAFRNLAKALTTTINLEDLFSLDFRSNADHGNPDEARAIYSDIFKGGI